MKKWTNVEVNLLSLKKALLWTSLMADKKHVSRRRRQNSGTDVREFRYRLYLNFDDNVLRHFIFL